MLLALAHLAALSGLCLETALDGADGALRATGLACHEVDAVLLGKQRVRRATCLARNVFDNVAPEHIFDLFRLEPTTNNEALTAVNRTHSTQLGKEILDNMLGLAVHTLADFQHIGKYSLFRAIALHDRRHHGVLFLLARESRVLRAQDAEEAMQELLVRIVTVRVVPQLGIGLVIGLFFSSERIVFFRCILVIRVAQLLLELLEIKCSLLRLLLLLEISELVSRYSRQAHCCQQPALVLPQQQQA